MRLRYIGILAVLAMIMAFAAAPVAAVTEHCPGGDGNGAPAGAIEDAEGSITEEGVLIEWSGDPGTVTITNNNDIETATVTFCAKGGDDFAGEGDKASGNITVTLLPGEFDEFDFGTEISYFVLVDVVLTTPPAGTLTVIKQTLPDAAAGSFTFSATLGGVTQPSFTLSDGQSMVFTGNGVYVINETAMPTSTSGTWTLTDIDCGTAAVTETATGVTVTVTANAAISCTFTNTFTATALSPTLSLDKEVTAGADRNQEFGFTYGLSGAAATTLNPTLSANDAAVQLASAAGTYVITELDPGAWRVQSISCTGDSGTQESVVLGQRMVTVVVGANDDVICTFVNTPTGGGTNPSTGGPASQPASQAATPVRAGTLANTAMENGPADQAPALIAALVALGSLALIARRNIAAIRQRS